MCGTDHFVKFHPLSGCLRKSELCLKDISVLQYRVPTLSSLEQHRDADFGPPDNERKLVRRHETYVVPGEIKVAPCLCLACFIVSFNLLSYQLKIPTCGFSSDFPDPPSLFLIGVSNGERNTGYNGDRWILFS